MGFLRKDWKFIWNKWVVQKYKSPWNEPQVRNCLKRIRGDVFVDVGASGGIYSTLLNKNFQKIYAVEPNPAAIKQWKDKPKNVTIVPLALSNQIGSTRLYLDIVCPSILPAYDYKPSDPGLDKFYRGQEFIEVQTRTYDSLFGIADLVKIDVEGAEFLVIEGMGRSLRDSLVKNIMVEVHNRERKSEMELLLKNYGFFTTWLDSDHIFGTLSV